MSLAFHECCIYVTSNQKVLIASAISPAHARGEEYLSIEQLEALSEAGRKSGKGGKGKKAKKKINFFFLFFPLLICPRCAVIGPPKTCLTHDYYIRGKLSRGMHIQ